MSMKIRRANIMSRGATARPSAAQSAASDRSPREPSIGDPPHAAEKERRGDQHQRAEGDRQALDADRDAEQPVAGRRRSSSSEPAC